MPGAFKRGPRQDRRYVRGTQRSILVRIKSMQDGNGPRNKQEHGEATHQPAVQPVQMGLDEARET